MPSDDESQQIHPRARSGGNNPMDAPATIEKSDSEHREVDGRCVEIDTGFYRVQVWGDPEDSFEEVREQANTAADRAKADVKDLRDTDDKGGYK